MKDVLVIVPSYNESKNIRKVEKDLKENFPEADILFINDKSKDNTLDIIKTFDDVSYLDLPVNLGYFYAIQSGLKYADSKGYNYVVQFDGDGQHLAKEARKIYKHAKEKNLDIVIGSRFLEETDYKHPFFRKIGTKVFSSMVKGLTGQKIYDPTSGLQVLDKKVVNYLSKIYNYPEIADANLLMDLIYQNFSIGEVTVKMKLNDTGASMHSGIIAPTKYVGRTFYHILAVYLKHLFNMN